jgi:hypothetical protein
MGGLPELPVGSFLPWKPNEEVCMADSGDGPAKDEVTRREAYQLPRLARHRRRSPMRPASLARDEARE